MTSFYTVLGLSIYKLTGLLTKNVVLSVIAIPLFFSMSLGSLYYLLFPATLGLTFLGLVLSILFSKSGKGIEFSVIFILIVLGMIVTHFYDPLILVFVFFLFFILRKRLKLGLQTTRILVTMVIADFMWNFFVATNYATSDR